MENRMSEVENKVVRIEFKQEAIKAKAESLEDSVEKNSKKLDDTHTLVSSIDKGLAVLLERVDNSLSEAERLGIRLGGTEDSLQDTISKIDAVKQAVSRISKDREISSSRKWNMVTLVPYALITALVTGGVAKWMNFTFKEEVAIKQTHIDKLQRQLDDLTKKLGDKASLSE